MTISSRRVLALLVLVFLLLCATSTTFADSKSSIYSINLTWSDDSGAKVSLKEYKDHYVVITMAYTACAAACPLTIERLKALEKKLAKHAKQVEFVIVTFDPGRD